MAQHMSATSSDAFKACPERYKLGYIERLRLAQEPVQLRMGNNWHIGQEALGNHKTVEQAVDLACAQYATVPDWADLTAWLVERETLANALAVYAWLYSADEYETLCAEVPFELPLTNPETGGVTPTFVRVGKIDKILRNKRTGVILLGEHKSTSKPIDSASVYWNRLRLDAQTTNYLCAAREMQAAGTLPGVPATPVISGLLHDVWRKPSIEPRKLTQTDTVTFLATGDYMGQHFDVKFTETPAPVATVDGLIAVIEIGATPKATKADPTPKPKLAIRETPGMYGARLFADMTGNKSVMEEARGPEWYFARREVPRTDAELEAFRYELWALQRTIAEMQRTGHWYTNGHACETTFKCPFMAICYNNLDVSNGNTPPGYRRLDAAKAETTDITGKDI